MRAGITGSYASGKGTVSEILAGFGAVVVDTDIIARDLMMPGMALFDEIVSRFGNRFLLPDGNLDRRSFAKEVFRDETLTAELNRITHPVILEETLRRTGGDAVYAVNVPLLFESGFDRLMDFTVLVAVPEEMSIERGILRDGLTREEIILRLSRQMSLNEKRKVADYVIDNSGTIESTNRQVRELWNILISRKNR